MGEQIGADMNFVLGQIFVFGNIALFTDLTGHLSQVEAFAPGWIVRFDNMEYTADSRGELVFSSWVLDQIEEQQHTPVPTPM